MRKEERIAVLFSGGADSSLVAAKAAVKAEKVYLLTCITQCMTGGVRLEDQVKTLKSRFTGTEFVHIVLSAEKILRWLWNDFAVNDILQAGFYRSYPCAVCKFAMHVRALVFCLVNNIGLICDGNNVMMSFNPCQNVKGIRILGDLYRDYGIVHESPVYWYENVDVMLLSRFKEFKDDSSIQDRILRGKDTGREAAELGIIDDETKLDVKKKYSAQPVCTQAVYSTFFLHCFFFPLFGYRRLERTMLSRLARQSEKTRKVINKYFENGSYSHLFE